MTDHRPIEQPPEEETTTEKQTDFKSAKVRFLGVGNPNKIMVLGIEVGGWGSVLALIISIVTLLWTAYDTWIVRPDPLLWPPEEVNFSCDDRDKDGCAGADKFYLRANPITFLNKATGNHPYTVRSMDASVLFKDAAGASVRELCLDWQYLSNNRDSAGPFEVSLEAPFVQEIQFFARRKFVDGAINRANFLPFREMEAVIVDRAVKSVVLTFEAQVVGRTDRLTASCTMPVDDDVLGNASGHTFDLYSRECFATESLEPRCL